MNTILHRLSQKGTTLVEVLIVMGLLSVMLVILVTIFTSAVDTQQQSAGYSATISGGRFIMARLDYDIAHASAITAPALGRTASSLTLTVGGATYTYGLSGDNLQLTDDTGTANLNSDDVSISALQFHRLGNSGGKQTVQYTFTATGTASSHTGQSTQTFTSTAGLR